MAGRNQSLPFLKQFKSEADDLFLSPGDIDRYLGEFESYFKLSGLGIQVTVHDVILEWADCGGKEVVSSKIGHSEKVAIFVGNNCDVTDYFLQQAFHNLLEVFQIAWSKEYRNAHGGLDLKISGSQEILLKSISNRSDKFSIIYLDLDNFKKVNDRCGHPEGDKALRTVYSEMHKLARDLKGFAFFDGGDEFILLFPTTDILEISAGMWTLLKNIKSKTYGAEEVVIGFTAGVAIRSVAEIYNSFNKIKGECELLTKRGTEEKQRGTISFENLSKASSIEESPAALENFYKLGISFSRSKQSTTRPFEDERLNLISNQVFEYFNDSDHTRPVETVVKEIVEWFGSEIIKDVKESDLLHPAKDHITISKHAVAVAVSHGIAKSLTMRTADAIENVLKVNWSEDKLLANVTLNETKLWGDDISSPIQMPYGPTLRGLDTLHCAGIFSGVQIGFDSKPLTPGGHRFPQAFFADHVIVDMRPRSGGGLPDFWQVALAQVVSCLGKMDGIKKVLIWGEDATNSETYKKLSDPQNWSIDEIAHLTGLQSEKIRSVGNSIKEKIVIIDSAEMLLNEIYNGYQSISEFVLSTSIQSDELIDPIRRPMAAIANLPQNEGVICTTAALAYPIIIDILRKSADIRISKDDVGQEHRELIAFKLKLTDPRSNPIPRYLEKHEEELDSYAKKVLLESDGLIRTHLENTDQVSACLHHLATYVTSGAKATSTRRACMVVPHIPTDTSTPKPWGLISIWVTPRHSASGTVLLDFVFVWRTVEAFIGLPYSLYGSIKFAEQFVGLVQAQVTSQSEKANLELGELTYIALSLHLGGDQFHSRVAKQIVDLASD